MIDFTVAICTYNGATRLPKVLDKLRSATLFTKERAQFPKEDFSWEIVVIDNNSADKTAKVVEEYQLTWSQTYPLRYYFEPKQGLAFARRCAIKVAQGSLVGFLDDDNLPTDNWVSAAYSFGQSHPQVGAFGSQIYGDYEIEPPENFERISCFLAIIERGQKPIRYDAQQWIFPAGAGLVIRKQAWLDTVPEHPFLKGVSANSLASKGEDIETLTYLKKAGWEIWHNPQMCIYHQIPSWRLEKDYLIKLFRGVGLSRYPTRMLRFKAWQQPFVLIAYLTNDLRKLIIHLLKYHQVLETDIVAACEIQLFLSSLISPFYHWKKRYSISHLD